MNICTEVLLKHGKIDRRLTDAEILELSDFALELLAEFQRLTEESIAYAKFRKTVGL
jgi:hypothetical protein